MLSFTECCMLVIGDIMLDKYMATLVGRISPEAPVPVARVQKQWCVPGGAANVACNLIHLGCKVTLVGLRGHDNEGEHLQFLLSAKGIKSSLVFTDDRPTPCKTRIVAMGQQLLRLDNEEKADLLPQTLEHMWNVIQDELQSATVVVLSDYDKGVFRRFPSGDSLAERIIAACRKRRTPVLVDPKGADWGRYAHADCITPNTKELANALNVSTDSFSVLQEGASRLMQRHHLPRILLTRSEKGIAFLQHGAANTEISTQARDVADVSGAGDTVIAVAAACVAKGMDWISAARMANTAAGIVVGKVGTSPIELAELRAAVETSCGLGKDLSRLNAKIYTLERLAPKVESWRRKGKKVVFTNGCFDLLHMGHIQLIEEAAAQGDKLIVALNADISVKRLKGVNRPIQPENARAIVIAALEGVDAVILFDEDAPQQLIEVLSPNVLVKGGDYDVQSVVGAQHVISCGGRVHLTKFMNGYSTTNIISQFFM